MAPLGAHDIVLCMASMGFRPLREFAEAAGKAGFSAISLSGGDYEAARAAGLSEADIRAMLIDNGLRVAEIDGTVDWLNPSREVMGAGYDLSIPFFGHSERRLLEIAETVGARSITAVDPFMWTVPLDRMVEAFARLCDRVAECGLLVHLEFLSWGPVPNLHTAWEIVRQADRPNGGLALDVLHLMRSDSRALLETIPGERIFATQFCDGPAERIGDCFADVANRALPGEGAFDLVEIVRTLDAGGCNAPVGVEVMNPTLSALAAEEVARRCHRSIASVLHAARSRTLPPKTWDRGAPH